MRREYREELIGRFPGVAYRRACARDWAVEFRVADASTLAGHRVADLSIGRLTYEELIHPDDDGRVRTSIQRIVVSRERLKMDYRVRTAAGKDLWVREYGCGITNARGEVDAIAGFITDLEECLPAAESVTRWDAHERRSQRLMALGVLAGGIAHEFNNLLTAITGYADLCAAELSASHGASANVAEIIKAGARATELVRGILSFTRDRERSLEALDLRAVVDDALKLLRATLPAMISIDTTCAADIPAVSADAGELHQVVLNLGTNAAHAMGSRGGRIRVELAPVALDSETSTRLGGLPAGRYVRLTFSDTGSGMDEATRKRIFEPFFTTKTEEQGVGLGLSIVQKIMTRHHGVITVDSRLGVGSTFTVYFPALDAPAPVVSAPSRVAERGHGECVLYVDDEESLVTLMTRRLSPLGYHIIGATDATMALANFRACPEDFDVVVTDMGMPGLSGVDLARQIKIIRPNIPVILTSGYLRPEEQQDAERAGVDMVVLKPNTVAELGHVIHNFVAGRGATPTSGKPAG
ncbi:MAG: hybrid sensor histidine kinase/response regulator [Nitrospirota bacterium]